MFDSSFYDHMKHLLFLFICSFLFSSCARRDIYLNLYYPPRITLPKNVNKVSLINRSQAKSKKDVINKIDEFLTMETGKIDARSSKACVNSLFDEFIRTQRFNEIKFRDTTYLNNAYGEQIPPPLDWREIERICTEDQTELLISLESFDSDSRVNYRAEPASIQTPLGNVPALEHHATITTNIKLSWRIYDPARKFIYDLYPMNQTVYSKGKGINPMRAIEAVRNKDVYIIEQSQILGKRYGRSFVGNYFRTGRSYYQRGGNKLKTAGKYFRTGVWSEAEKIWNEILDGSYPKRQKGKALYNLALIHEKEGELEMALKLLSRSFAEYNVRAALKYSKSIRIRKQRLDRERADQLD